jgi:hypothetical protein
MKTVIWHLTKVAILLLITFFIINACGGANKPEGKLIGKWRLIETTEHGVKLKRGTTNWNDYRDKDIVTEFYPDRTYIYANSVGGTWVLLEDGRLKTTSQSGSVLI